MDKNKNLLDNEISNLNQESINSLHLEMFKEKVKEWLSLDDDIKTLNGHLKERKKKKNELTPEILDFMQQHKITDMNTDSGKLKYAQTLTKKPMNKEYIRSKLLDFLKNAQKANEATDFLIDQRETKVNVKLKRVKAK